MTSASCSEPPSTRQRFSLPSVRLNDTGSEDRNLNVSVYIVRQMSKSGGIFSQLIDPEDRNAERGCQVLGFLFPDTSFSRHSLDLPGESFSPAPWSVCDNCSGILEFFTFFCQFVLKYKYCGLGNLFSTADYLLEMILSFTSVQWKGFFPRGKVHWHPFQIYYSANSPIQGVSFPTDWHYRPWDPVILPPFTLHSFTSESSWPYWIWLKSYHRKYEAVP